MSVNPKQIFISDKAPSAAALLSSIISSLGRASVDNGYWPKVSITVAEAATNLSLLFPISTQTEIMSSTKAPHLPQSSTGNVILISLAEANGIKFAIFSTSLN